MREPTKKELKELDLTDVEVGGESIRASNLWDVFRDFIGYGGMDVAAYVSGGMSVWPCGATFQEGGRDGFKDDIGNDDCRCDLCNRVRLLLLNDDQVSNDWLMIYGQSS